MTEPVISPGLVEIERYYSAKLEKHGATAQGVDWNSESSQQTRFEQLIRVVNASKRFTVNDLGCGYGALFAFLASRFENFSYRGVDLSEGMIRAAVLRHQRDPRCSFQIGSSCGESADFTLASGIFNVRLGMDTAQWEQHLYGTLDQLDAMSLRGFAFNCLTGYSDAGKMRPDLYYADPCRLFEHCHHRYSRNVALLHDYGLYEFTVLVRKTLG